MEGEEPISRPKSKGRKTTHDAAFTAPRASESRNSSSNDPPSKYARLDDDDDESVFDCEELDEKIVTNEEVLRNTMVSLIVSVLQVKSKERKLVPYIVCISGNATSKCRNQLTGKEVGSPFLPGKTFFFDKFDDKSVIESNSFYQSLKRNGKTEKALTFPSWLAIRKCSAMKGCSSVDGDCLPKIIQLLSNMKTDDNQDLHCEIKHYNLEKSQAEHLLDFVNFFMGRKNNYASRSAPSTPSKHSFV